MDGGLEPLGDHVCAGLPRAVYEVVEEPGVVFRAGHKGVGVDGRLQMMVRGENKGREWAYIKRYEFDLIVFDALRKREAEVGLERRHREKDKIHGCRAMS